VKLFPRVPEQRLRDLIPNSQDGELLQDLWGQVLYFLVVLNALLNEHHYFLVVVVYVVVFQDLALGVVANHLQELF
jgi:hypothetical protein